MSNLGLVCQPARETGSAPRVRLSNAVFHGGPGLKIACCAQNDGRTGVCAIRHQRDLAIDERSCDIENFELVWP